MGVFLTAPTWATPPPAPPAAVARGGSAATPALPAIRQQVEHNQVEVKRLRNEVARQESASQRASERLEQQDRQIAELRRKLSQLQADPAAGQP
ncbi:MAG TPA: hypothetical protein VN624_05595 [Rhodanobacter sp.]|nr:hypothetical protein [Rhodanobacter sp.]